MIAATVAKRNGKILKRARYSDLKRAGWQAVGRRASGCRATIRGLEAVRRVAARRTCTDLNRQVAASRVKRFEFVEREFDERVMEEQGLTEFLRDPALSGTATPEEIALLKRLRFTRKRLTALFYYRELQSLRDPLHFRTPQGPDRR